MQLLQIMLDVIAPIMLIMGAGYLIGKRFDPDPRSLSVFLIYLFTPSLVFSGIYTTELPTGDLIGVAGVVVGVALVMMAIGFGVARLLRYSARAESALILSLVLVNAANYGIPLNTFAFGEAGGQVAIFYYVISALVGNVLGVYFASRGSVSARAAAANVFKVPIAYAAVIGLVLNLADVELPTLIQRSILDIAAPASIPVMLALLGLQLSRVSLRLPDGAAAAEQAKPADEATLAGDLKAVLLGAGLRLLAAPLVALVLATALGLSGVTYNVAIVESSMPTAVLASALATQFGGDARYVSAVTLIGTLASILTLSVLVLWLGGPI